jgi:hypothetical protein
MGEAGGVAADISLMDGAATLADDDETASTSSSSLNQIWHSSHENDIEMFLQKFD